MTEKTLLEHLECIGEIIDAYEHAELVDDSTPDVTDAVKSFHVLEKFFKGYYEAQAVGVAALSPERIRQSAEHLAQIK